MSLNKLKIPWRRESEPALGTLKVEIVSDGKVVSVKEFDDPRVSFIEELSRSSSSTARIPRKKIGRIWKWMIWIVVLNCCGTYLLLKNNEVLVNGRASTQKEVGPIPYRRMTDYMRYMFSSDPHRCIRTILPMVETEPHAVEIRGPVGWAPSERFEPHGESYATIPGQPMKEAMRIDYHYGRPPEGMYETDQLSLVQQSEMVVEGD